MNRITPEQRAAVDRTAYAYEGANGKIHWGLNGNQGFNVARGVLKPGETL